ncbi:MAG: O-antigen ligase family protein [Bacteriovorax sp.]|nr:O-antigen ligase family protein [Bacteriovorax sp.]
MIAGDNFLFTLHQFIISTLCLFFVYFAWRDQAAKTFDRLENVSLKIIVPLLIGLFLGLTMLFINEWGSAGIIISFAFALLITMSVFDPKYAVSFFIFLLISRPWEIFKDQVMAGMPRDIFVLCFLSFIGHKLVRKRFYFQWNMASACVLFFAVWTFFSIIPSEQIIGGLLNYEENFIKGIIVYFLIVNVVDKKEFILPIQSALVLGISEKAIMSFYNSVVLGKVAEGDRLVSTGIFENSNDIAAIMILVIPFTLSFLKGISSTILRYLFSVIVFSFYFYLIWQSKSRGAILGIGALAVGWFWLKSANKKLATFIVIVGFCLSIATMSLIKRDSEDVEGSTSNRKIYWLAALKMGIKHPLLGVGYDGFPLKLFEYTDGHVGTEGQFKTAHSTWLLALAETGVVGFIFYIGIWFYSFKSAWSMKIEHPEFILAILSYGTAITFLSHTYLLYPYILLGLTVASGQFYMKKKNEAPINGLEAALISKGLQ